MTTREIVEIESKETRIVIVLTISQKDSISFREQFITESTEIVIANEIEIETNEIKMIESIRIVIEFDSKIFLRINSKSSATTVRREITTKVNVDSRRRRRKPRRQLNRTIKKKPSISRRNLDRAESNS